MSSFVALALAPLLFSRFALSQSCSTVSNIKLTYYGYPDGNSDASALTCAPGVAHNAGGTAGGSGTYQDPFTFATMEGSTNFQECETIYVPYLKKYFKYMDHCTGCDNNHIDLWIGTDTSGGQAQITCEEDLGSQDGQTIIKDPPSGLDVVAQNLWDGSCHNTEGQTLFANADTSSLCSGGGGGTGGGQSSSAAAVAPASTSSAPATPAQTPPAKNPPPPPANPPTTTTTTTPAVPANPWHPKTFATHTTVAWGGQGGCAWPGHCIGAPCQDYNDCSGDWICIAGKCHSNLDD